MLAGGHYQAVQQMVRGSGGVLVPGAPVRLRHTAASLRSAQQAMSVALLADQGQPHAVQPAATGRDQSPTRLPQRTGRRGLPGQEGAEILQTFKNSQLDKFIFFSTPNALIRSFIEI